MGAWFGAAGREPSALGDVNRGRTGTADPRMPLSVFRDPSNCWALSISSPGIVDALPEEGPPRAAMVFLRGDLYNETDLRARVRDPQAPLSRVLAALYAMEGPEFVARLDGEFAVVVIDAESRRVVLATDPFGLHPIYLQAGTSRLAFSSDVGALLRSRGDAPALNMRAVADFLTMGFVLGDKTLADGVSLLDPGTILTYEWCTGRMTTSRYFEPVELYQGVRSDKAAYVERVCGTFTQAVRKSLSGTHTFGLSLSGGLDSRALLSAVDGSARDLITYTVGVEGCADQAIAKRLAGLAGTNHRFFPLDQKYLRDFLGNQARMVTLTDGMYLSHGLTEMLVLDFLHQTGIDVLLRGHGGELAKASLAYPLHTDARVYEMTDPSAFVEYLAGRANYVSQERPFETLFTPDALRVAGRGARDSMTDILAGVRLTPAEMCTYLYLREHQRRYTVQSLELFRTTLEVRLPFLDREFLQALLSAPPGWHDDTSVHRAITAAGHPALLKIRNSNTGAPGDASPVVEKAFDKLNTLMKRLHVPGYRHYHNFDAWMRTMLIETVQSELLSPAARIGIFMRPEAIRALVNETRSGRRDWGYLLQVLLIVELWLREYRVDRIAS